MLSNEDIEKAIVEELGSSNVWELKDGKLIK
jgi:hypothetical protein